MPDAAGASLGRFRLLRRLGAGGMGEVWLAEDPRIGRHVALKTVRVDGAPEKLEDARRRLELEARAAGRLVHPHAVTLFEAGEGDGLFFLAFEYVEGEDLAARMRRPPPPVLADVLRWAREAASALEAAHRAGIVHRDVKPSNLLLAADGTLKVADFGIAKLDDVEVHLTRTGSVVGTPHYASPEQVRGEPLDGRSDLFSLGVVVYQLLARRLPFAGEGLPELVHAILSREPEPLAGLRPDLPPRLAGIVARLLAKERDDRFPTAASLVDELVALEGSLGPGVATLTLAPAPARETPPPLPAPGARGAPAPGAGVPSRRRRAVVLVPAVGAALLFGSAALVVALRPGQDGDSASAPSAAPRADPAPEARPLPVPTPARAPAEAPPDGPTARPRVGTAVTFRVTPEEAAAGAVVKVDGLVRGPAAGSLVTLRPGVRRIEVVSDGWEPFVLEVEAGAGGEGAGTLEAPLRAR